jgi:uncharacterized Zn finger protein
MQNKEIQVTTAENVTRSCSKKEVSELDSVEIYENASFYKGDTIVYNADSF